MLGLKVDLRNAQEVKRYLEQHDLFDRRYRLQRDEHVVVFPITREFSIPWDFDVDFVETEADPREMHGSLRSAVLPHLTNEEAAALRTAYDIVGTIAIIDMPLILEPKEQLIGEKLLESNPIVKTVLKKIGGHQGVYRTQQLACIAGVDTRVTTVVENGVRLKVHVEDAYYSVRMSTERKRIVQLIKPGERVLCLFSGVGPYPITFARHTKAAVIVGIEINPKAHELAVENAATNRCTNVRLLCGDANEVMARLAQNEEQFDRITMPLPHTASEFLDATLSVTAPGGTIHYYTFLREGAFDEAVNTLRDACRRNKRELVSHQVVRTGQQAPRVWRVCVDAVIK